MFFNDDDYMGGAAGGAANGGGEGAGGGAPAGEACAPRAQRVVEKEFFVTPKIKMPTAGVAMPGVGMMQERGGVELERLFKDIDHLIKVAPRDVAVLAALTRKKMDTGMLRFKTTNMAEWEPAELAVMRVEVGGGFFVLDGAIGAS